MKADFIRHMGDDLMVVNAARVSFAKESVEMCEKDIKLINYLARHKHWTPFSHPQITFRMTAPIFVARQAFKHKVGFTENEISRRYVDDAPEFFMPKEWRGAPDNRKQGSSNKTISVLHQYGKDAPIDKVVETLYATCTAVYSSMIESGVAPEQARMVLPQGMYSSWYWTGSLAAWARFYALRTDSHAQSEIQELAKQIGPKMEELFPVCWKALTDGQPT